MNSEQPCAGDELLKHLLDHIDDNIYFKDLNSRFILVNRAFSERLGCAPEEMIGKTDFDIFTLEHARPAFEAERQILKTGEPVLGLEEKETWADGHETWVSTTKMPLRDRQGRIIGTCGISRDITEHKLQEIKQQLYAAQLATIHAQMQEELKMAAVLQTAFLPASYPRFQGPSGRALVEFYHCSQFAGQIGGDLCMAVKTGDNQAGLLICDVMGHGVHAALVTAILFAMANELLHGTRSPDVLLTELNRMLHPLLNSESALTFVTACCLILDPATGRVQGASAGHPPPFRISRKAPPGEQASILQESIQANGPALALIENHPYTPFTLFLQPYETLLLYTDGLTECTGADGEEFGLERVRAILNSTPDTSPHSACTLLIREASAFASAAEENDDICLLAARWNGPAWTDEET